MASEMTVITYGGGEILFQLFTGIKMIFDSGFIKSLAFLMASLTAVYSIFSSYFSLNPDHLIKQFLLPIVALSILCFSVKTTVIIEDILPLSSGGINWISKEAFDPDNGDVNRNISPSKTVEGVPFIIGFIAKGISTVGHKLTVAVESIFHMADDDKYSRTGMVFGADTALDMNEIIINDGNLESNLRTFCRTCMVYDMALNLYTINDLKNETNLLKLLKEKTGTGRYMNYVNSQKGASELVSCKSAIERISEKLKKGGSELKHQQKKQIFKNLPLAYQALTKMSGDSTQIMQQLLMMSVASDTISSEAFALKKASLQQKTSWKMMGGIADGLIITTRGVIEGLIYGAIIFVIPLMFLPSGFSYLKTWVWLLVWIQLWPPFYCILDYVSLIAARGQAEGLVDASLTSKCCLNIYNTIGLSNIYGNISAYAKSMKMLIPPLSYAILQGGVGSFVHLTSSMMGASQQAIASASSDELSGNYNFGNTSMSTGHFANSSYGQQNYASSLTSGFIREDTIKGTTMYASEDSNVSENLSKFSFSVSEDKAIQSSLSSNLMSSQTAHEASTESFSNCISNTGREMMDFTSHLAHDTSYSTSESGGDSSDVSRSAQFCQNTVESFAKDHGISNQTSWEIFSSIGAGVPYTSASLGGSLRKSGVLSDTWNHAVSASETKEFREAFSSVENFVSNCSHNETDGEGVRLANSMSHSIDNLKSSQEQYSATFDQMNQASKTSSYYNNLSYSERKDLSQDFLNYAVEENEYSVNQFKELIYGDSPDELGSLISNFGSTRIPEMEAHSNFIEPKHYHANNVENIRDLGSIQTSLDKDSFSQDFTGDIKEKVETKLNSRNSHEGQIKEVQEQIKAVRDTLKPPEIIKLSRWEVDLEVNWDQSKVLIIYNHSDLSPFFKKPNLSVRKTYV